MISIRPFLLVAACIALLMTQPCFAQPLTNTGTTITLTGTCMNGAFTGGTYTLGLAYADPDNGYTTVPNIPGCNVTSNGTTLTITAAGASFPTPAANGYWQLSDADNGVISLTGGPTGSIVYWYHNPDGSIQFNCVALPIWFTSFIGSYSGPVVHLTWNTELEQNSTVIEIYRSSTGSNFYKAGQVTAAGNSSIVLPYSFTDNNADAQNYYYLKMLNSQGTPAIISSIIHVSCPSCHYTPPTPVNCAFTINGPSAICNIETPTAYTLSAAVPNYSSITWSIDNAAYAHLATYPNFDRTQVTLLKKGTGGGVTLRATLSGCSNVITRFVAMGTPAPTISTSLSCPTLSATAGNSPGATDYEWHVVDLTTFTETITHSTSPFKSASIGGGHSWNIGFQYTNGCGVSTPAVQYGFVCTGGGGGGHKIRLSPNPSSGILDIGLAPEPDPADVASPVIKNVRGITPGYAVAPVPLMGTAVQDAMDVQAATVGKVDQGKVDQEKVGQGNVNQGKVGQGTMNQAKVDQAKIDKGKIGQGKVNQGKVYQANVNQGTINQGKVNQGKIYQVRVVDGTGQVRKSFSYPGGVEHVTVNLSGLNGGIYTVQVFDDKTWTSSQVVLTK
jgi:hypothetical protein